MAGQANQIFSPSNYAEFFSTWEDNPSAVLFAGATGLIRGQGRMILDLPPLIISLDKLEELHRISRTERYLEIGAMVKLNQIINLGKVVPGIFRDCLENIGGLQIRNMATIGGNICSPEGRLDCPAALCALDAQYELKNAQTSRWISALRFSSLPGLSALGLRELLTRIRIPIDQWDISAYIKFSGQAIRSKAAVFLAKTQKNTLSDIRFIYKADSILRDRNSESILVGKRLPISRRIAADFVDHWGTFLSGAENVDELSKKELINFIEKNVYNLTE